LRMYCKLSNLTALQHENSVSDCLPYGLFCTVVQAGYTHMHPHADPNNIIAKH